MKRKSYFLRTRPNRGNSRPALCFVSFGRPGWTELFAGSVVSGKLLRRKTRIFVVVVRIGERKTKMRKRFGESSQNINSQLTARLLGLKERVDKNSQLCQHAAGRLQAAEDGLTELKHTPKSAQKRLGDLEILIRDTEKQLAEGIDQLDKKWNL